MSRIFLKNTQCKKKQESMTFLSKKTMSRDWLPKDPGAGKWYENAS